MSDTITIELTPKQARLLCEHMDCCESTEGATYDAITDALAAHDYAHDYAQAEAELGLPWVAAGPEGKRRLVWRHENENGRRSTDDCMTDSQAYLAAAAPEWRTAAEEAFELLEKIGNNNPDQRVGWSSRYKSVAELLDKARAKERGDR